MIRVIYSELDGPEGLTLRLEASGHAGYAPAGQDIVCAGASTLMQTLCALLAGEEGTKSGVWDEPDGPRLAVTAAAPQKPWVEGAFEFAKAGFALLAERYPDHVRFADLSGRGEQSMVDLQMFASEGGDAASSAPALSHAQAQQAIASGTMTGDLAALCVPDFKRIERGRGLQFETLLPGRFGRMFSGVARRALRSEPRLAKKECVGCGKCRDICPAHAIRIVNRRAVIDKKVCIRCFCCQEFCPKGAMRVHRPLPARLLNR